MTGLNQIRQDGTSIKAAHPQHKKAATHKTIINIENNKVSQVSDPLSVIGMHAMNISPRTLLLYCTEPTKNCPPAPHGQKVHGMDHCSGRIFCLTIYTHGQ